MKSLWLEGENFDFVPKQQLGEEWKVSLLTVLYIIRSRGIKLPCYNNVFVSSIYTSVGDRKGKHFPLYYN